MSGLQVCTMSHESGAGGVGVGQEEIAVVEVGDRRRPRDGWIDERVVLDCLVAGCLSQCREPGVDRLWSWSCFGTRLREGPDRRSLPAVPCHGHQQHSPVSTCRLPKPPSPAAATGSVSVHPPLDNTPTSSDTKTAPQRAPGAAPLAPHNFKASVAASALTAKASGVCRLLPAGQANKHSKALLWA